MPLPLLPAVLIGGAAAAGVKGAVDTITGLKKIKKAKKRYQRRRERYELAELTHRRHHKRVEERLAELGKTRLRAMKTLRTVAEFVQRARVTTRPRTDTFAITAEELERWQGGGIAASKALDKLSKGVGAGVGTASLVYQAATAFGTASTGAAIGSLSGAAAESATLAWLGGGALAAGGGGIALGTAVLGGLVAGPAILMSGFFVASQAEQVKTEVANKIAEMDIAEAKMLRKQAVLAAVTQRIGELELQICRLVVQIEELLSTADPTRTEDVYLVVRLARALAVAVQTSVLGETEAGSDGRKARG